MKQIGKNEWSMAGTAVKISLVSMLAYATLLITVLCV